MCVCKSLWYRIKQVLWHCSLLQCIQKANKNRDKNNKKAKALFSRISLTFQGILIKIYILYLSLNLKIYNSQKKHKTNSRRTFGQMIVVVRHAHVCIYTHVFTHTHTYSYWIHSQGVIITVFAIVFGVILCSMVLTLCSLFGFGFVVCGCIVHTHTVVHVNFGWIAVRTKSLRQPANRSQHLCFFFSGQDLRCYNGYK